MSVISFGSKELRDATKLLRDNGADGFVVLVRDNDTCKMATLATMPELLVYTMNLISKLDQEHQVKAIQHISKVAMETAAKAMGEADDA